MIKTTLKKTKSSITLTITADEQFIAPYKQAVLKRLKKDLKVSGFRPGNVPDNIAERELGPERVQAEVLEEVIMHAYTKAVREEKIETIASPKVVMKKFVPYTELEFEAEAPVMPEVVLNLKAIKVKKPEVKVEDKEVQETIEAMAHKSAKHSETKGPIKKGHEITFDFKGTQKGVAVEGASAKDHKLTVGEGSFIPGFEDNLIGLSLDEEKTFEVTFPKDYHAKELAGKPVNFEVKVKQIHQVELPKLDDEWAKTTGPVKDLKELKVRIRESIEHNKQIDANKEYENKVIDEIVNTAKFEAPEVLVNQQKQSLEQETIKNLQNSGLDLDKYLQIQKRTKEDFDNELTEEATKRVKFGIILRSILESEKITISDADVDAEITRMQQQYTDPKMQEEMTHSHFKDDVKNHLLTQKAMTNLLEQVKK